MKASPLSFGSTQPPKEAHNFLNSCSVLKKKECAWSVNFKVTINITIYYIYIYILQKITILFFKSVFVDCVYIALLHLKNKPHFCKNIFNIYVQPSVKRINIMETMPVVLYTIGPEATHTWATGYARLTCHRHLHSALAKVLF